MRRAATRVRRSEFRPSLDTLRGKHSIDKVSSSWVLHCWKVLVFLVIPFQTQVLFIFPLHVWHQNVDVFGPYLATFCCWNLHSLWFPPVSSARSPASFVIFHLGFTWFHGNNVPEESNPFIPVRIQSIYTLVSSSPIPCSPSPQTWNDKRWIKMRQNVHKLSN